MEERRTVIEVTEAAYRLGGSESRWLARILEHSSEELDLGLGMAGWRLAFATGQVVPGPAVVTGSLPGDMATQLHSSIAPSGVQALRSAELLTSWNAGVEVGWWGPLPEALGAIDLLWLSTYEANAGFAFVAPCAHPPDLSAAFRRRWQPVLTHIRIGARLRTSLATEVSGDEPQLAGPTDLANITLGAVRSLASDTPGAARPKSSAAPRLAGLMHPEGAVPRVRAPVHSDYEPSSARTRLRDLARRVDSAAASVDAPESIAYTPEQLWRGLMSGQWSLIDSFDTDGRRHLVIRQTPESAADPRGLTLREWQAARAAATGLSNKHIALTLGLGESTVATHLKRALTKLGLKSRMEFATAAAELDLIAPRADADDPDDAG